MIHTRLPTSPDENFRFGDACIMANSSIDQVSPDAYFSCGDDTQLKSVSITIRGNGRLTIGTGCELRGAIIVENGCEIIIGDGLICNDACKFHAADSKSIFIGNDCLFANVMVYSSDMHGIYDLYTGKRLNHSASVHIEHRVWIARDSVVLKGAHIGSDSVVAAGSIVSGQFRQSNFLLAGVPAKKLRDGICWDRAMSEHSRLQLPTTFSAAKFRSRAQRFDNEYVMLHGAPFLSLYEHASVHHVYLFYYTARALFETYFKKTNVLEVDGAHGRIALGTLHDVLQHCYLVSNKRNTACGAYLLATKVKMNMDDAQTLHAEMMKSTEHAEKRIRGLLGAGADCLFASAEAQPS